MKSRIESIGHYVPDKVVSTQELISQLENLPVFDLENVTGIKTRHVRAQRESSFHLAVNAANECLENSQYHASDLEVIIFCSITHYKENFKYYYEPGISFFIKNHIGAFTAINFDVSTACAGMFTGLYLLNNMIRTNTVSRGMVLSGECITPIAETAVKEIKEPFDEQFASLTVGDAAAAVILDNAGNEDEGIDFIKLMTCSGYADLCLGMPSMLHGGPALYTNNTQMHKEERCLLWTYIHEKVLSSKGRTFDEEKYDFIIHHQVGIKFTERMQKIGRNYYHIDMPEELSILEELGNTASTSHFIVLYDSIKQNKVKNGDKVLFIPAASGIVTGCMSAKLGKLEVC